MGIFIRIWKKSRPNILGEGQNVLLGPKTNTSRFDNQIRQVWEKTGLVCFHPQDDRIPEEIRLAALDHMLFIYGGRR